MFTALYNPTSLSSQTARPHCQRESGVSDTNQKTEWRLSRPIAGSSRTVLARIWRLIRCSGCEHRISRVHRIQILMDCHSWTTKTGCCGLWEKHKGNGVAPEGICAACRARSIRRSLAAASWWAEAPQSRGSGLNASAISSSQNRMWLQHRPQRTTRRTADGSSDDSDLGWRDSRCGMSPYSP